VDSSSARPDETANFIVESFGGGHKCDGGGEEDTKDTDKEIEGELKEEAQEGSGHLAAKAKDSAYLASS
jgi:hypothetical protein